MQRGGALSRGASMRPCGDDTAWPLEVSSAQAVHLLTVEVGGGGGGRGGEMRRVMAGGAVSTRLQCDRDCGEGEGEGEGKGGGED